MRFVKSLPTKYAQLYTVAMSNSNFESPTEDRGIVTDSNYIGMEGALEILHILKYLQQEGPNRKPQTALAEDIKTGQSAVSEALNGKVMPRLDTAVRLAHALGAPLGVEMGWNAYVDRRFHYPPPGTIVWKKKESIQVEPTTSCKPQSFPLSLSGVTFKVKKPIQAEPTAPTEGPPVTPSLFPLDGARGF